jgi:hypothetical protein
MIYGARPPVKAAMVRLPKRTRRLTMNLDRTGPEAADSGRLQAL